MFNVKKSYLNLSPIIFTNSYILKLSSSNTIVMYNLWDKETMGNYYQVVKNVTYSVEIVETTRKTEFVFII